jgi:hypothetical protein
MRDQEQNFRQNANWTEMEVIGCIKLFTVVVVFYPALIHTFSITSSGSMDHFYICLMEANSSH